MLTDPTAAISVFSVSSVLVVLAGGVTWGRMDNRVKALENQSINSIDREEFNLLKSRLDEIHEDVREIRRKLP